MSKVAVLMGSVKDRPRMEPAVAVLEEFQVPHEVLVLSAHKTPDAAIEFAAGAAGAGFSVIIAGAGKAAHLAGLMAAKSPLPVIGVPLSATLDGLDALLATVQMPTGVPVATVGIDGAANAALLAVAILALHDQRLADELHAYRRRLAAETMERPESPG